MNWKSIALVVALVVTTSIGPSRAEEPTGALAKIAQTGTVTLGHRESSIPFSYYDQQQHVVGYSQELMLKVVDDLKSHLHLPKLQVKLIPVTSANRLTLVQNGTIDLECGSTTNNAERQKQVAFSYTLFIVGTRLLTAKDSGIRDFADLAGKNVVTTAGTTSERLLRKMNQEATPAMEIISTRDHGESFLTLETGRAVAFMMDDALLYGEIAKAKSPDRWIVTGTPQSREAYGCMMRKDDPAFKRLVDQTLAGVMTSGEAEILYKKWFQSPIPPKGLNLNFPLSDQLRHLYQNPNDRALD